MNMSTQTDEGKHTATVTCVLQFNFRESDSKQKHISANKPDQMPVHVNKCVK